MDANRELPLTQPPSAHSSITSGSCPGTPEMRRRQEEAMRRLASQVRKRLSWDFFLVLGKNVSFSGTGWKVSCLTSLGALENVCIQMITGRESREELLEQVLLADESYFCKMKFPLHQIHSPSTLRVYLSQPSYFILTNVMI